MASGSFYDYTSSNNIEYLYLQTDYTTTAYLGYTRVSANLYVVVKNGTWNFTTYKSSTVPSLSINGSTKNLTQYEVKVGTTGNKYKVASNYVDIYHTTKTDITISSSINLSGITINSTGGKIGNYSASKTISLTPKSTVCSAPTSFTASSDNFESTVTLKWSGASGGVNNAISGYLIRYRTSADNSTWGNYKDLKTVNTTSTSGSYTPDMSSLVSRGYYVQFAIRTLTSDDDYYSNWKYSDVIRRKPYTACTAPTTFTVTPNNFESEITLSWSGAGAGTNNSISSYYIQYCISDNNSTWGDWTALKTISTTKTSHSLEIDVSAKVSRGKYIKFRIRTQGSAGSSYYSGYKVSSSVRRNPYSACTAPEVILVHSENDINGTQSMNVFNTDITISWAGATAGTNNAITGYDIDYCTSADELKWNSWTNLQDTAIVTSVTVDMSSKVSRGHYVKFRIRTKGEQGSSYYSPYEETYTLKRNSVPELITFNIWSPITLEYSYGDTITLKWNKATDEDDNVNNYEIGIRFTQNGTWTAWDILDKNIPSNITEYNYIPSSTIVNNQQIQFRIRAKDVFGEYSSYVTSFTITRYDLTGVSIGVNGKWINCQIFVGTDGQWVEQEVSAGINGSWIDSDDGI